MEHAQDAAYPAAVSTHTPTLAEALTRYRREITPAKKGAKQEKNRIGQLLQNPLTALPIDRIRGAHLAAYRDERLRSGLSPITVRNELIVISHVYTIARTEWGHEGLPNPTDNIRKPKLPPGRNRRLNAGEEQRLLGAAETPLRAVIILAIETAMRRGEIARLTWPNIDLEQRIAFLPDTKNGTARTVPLSPRAIEALQQLGGGTRVCPYAPDSLSHAFRDACARVGIRHLRFHDLRHEATSRLFEWGFEAMEVSEITGHKSLQMLKRYTHLRAARLARKLAEVSSHSYIDDPHRALHRRRRGLTRGLEIQT